MAVHADARGCGGHCVKKELKAKFVKLGNAFCRTAGNTPGKENFEPGNGNDYQLFKGISFDECRDICKSEGPASSAGEQGYVCRGLEYYEADQECEVWYTEPAYVLKSVRGASCYRVEYS